jgi:hypothetical protein
MFKIKQDIAAEAGGEGQDARLLVAKYVILTGHECWMTTADQRTNDQTSHRPNRAHALSKGSTVLLITNL